MGDSLPTEPTEAELRVRDAILALVPIGYGMTKSEALCYARVAIVAMPEAWRPIASAPRDGSVILGIGTVYRGVPFPVMWEPFVYAPDRPWVQLIDKHRLYEHCIVWWMPVPPRPTVAAAA